MNRMKEEGGELIKEKTKKKDHHSSQVRAEIVVDAFKK